MTDAIILQALKDVWGYDSFRPHQAETIQTILNGHDSLTVLPTGGGKSLCYQLPAALSEGTAVVISPLIALMADQVQSLGILGIPAACLNSSMNADDIRQAKARMFQGELKLLYVSPERLLLDRFLDELTQIRLSFFAVDEAHCIAQWGHDFRPEYGQLGMLRDRFPNVSVHGFTATAPPQVRDEIQQRLVLREPQIFIGDYFRDNLKYQVLRRNKINQQLLEILGDFEKSDSGIIYCLTRKETERVADMLNANGFRALPYHAGMDAETRHRHQMDFSQEKVAIMVATIAFGMGIDQSNVRFVIHCGMPRTLSHYQQESGRAGRDGLPSRCVLIYGGNDINWWKRIIDQEGILVDMRLAQLRHMIDYANQIRCRHRTLVEHFGQSFAHANCKQCDVCLGELETISEARRYAQMILSAVLKTRQTFGAAHVAQVLTGSKDQKVIQRGHDQLSVYGLLKAFSQYQIMDWIGQLEGQGYLVRGDGQFPTIQVSRTGFWLLRPEKFDKTPDDLPVYLVETRKGERPKAQRAKGVPDAPFDQALFQRLRERRKLLADKMGVPAFVVFGDKSLQDMARKKPTDKRELLTVFGVGEAKLKKFGSQMIKEIRAYIDEME